MKPGDMTIHGFVINPMGIFFTILVMAVLFFFWRGQKNDSKFNVWDAFMSEGKTSILSMIFFGTWVAMTWVILNREMKNNLDISFYNFYAMTFAAPVITRLVGSTIKSFSSKEG